MDKDTRVRPAPNVPCRNCSHSDPHDAFAGSTYDACSHEGCECGYYEPAPSGEEVLQALNELHKMFPGEFFRVTVNQSAEMDEKSVVRWRHKTATIMQLSRGLDGFYSGNTLAEAMHKVSEYAGIEPAPETAPLTSDAERVEQLLDEVSEGVGDGSLSSRILSLIASIRSEYEQQAEEAAQRAAEKLIDEFASVLLVPDGYTARMFYSKRFTDIITAELQVTEAEP